VTVEVGNAGADAAIEPTVAFDLPEGWSLGGASVAGSDRWTVEDGAATAGVIGPGESVTVAIELLPEGPGTAAVGATLSDADGTEIDRTVELTAVSRPAAAVALDDPVVTEGEVVVFDAADATADGEIVAYEWDVTGDGTVDETTDGPVLEYGVEELGSRTVELTVVDEHGLSDTATATVTVTDKPSVTVDDGVVGESEPVTLEAEVENEIGAVTVVWELPDGTTVEGSTIEHAFHEPGDHDVTVLVTDEHGAETTTMTVTVEEEAEDGTGGVDDEVPGFGAGLAVLAVSILTGARLLARRDVRTARRRSG